MANRDILAIGTSAGGVEALSHLVSRWPSDFPAAILVTIHLSAQVSSYMDEVLGRASRLPAAFAKDGDALLPGRILIAPPARHLLTDGKTVSLGAGPRENHARPAIDPMLRSTALCCGHRTVGVVLTGTQGDGASGLYALNQAGGATVVQDPRDAVYPEMPLTALRKAKPQHIATLADMPDLLSRLVQMPAAEPRPAPANLNYEVEVARTGYPLMKQMDRIGRRSVLACPDCHGVMWEIDESDLIRYRCHVGHAHTEETMEVALEDNLRRALGSALRALDERVALADRLLYQAEQKGHRQVARHWAARKHEYLAEADVVRHAISRADEIGARHQSDVGQSASEPASSGAD